MVILGDFDGRRLDLAQDRDEVWYNRGEINDY